MLSLRSLIYLWYTLVLTTLPFTLDIACFKPFKTAFRQIRDAWCLGNKNEPVGKQTLCEWTSKALKRALTPTNIKSGFKGAGIWLLDREASKASMLPSRGFHDMGAGQGRCGVTVPAGRGEGGVTCLTGHPYRAGGAVTGQGSHLELADVACMGYSGAGDQIGSAGHGDRVGYSGVGDRAGVAGHRDRAGAATCSGVAESASGSDSDSRRLGGGDDSRAADLDNEGDAGDGIALRQGMHYYVDVPQIEESAYAACERDVEMDTEFPQHLQEHSGIADISTFLKLPETIPPRERRRQQPLLDFTKSKILTSHAYTESCQGVLAQKEATQAEAKRKAEIREATKETRR